MDWSTPAPTRYVFAMVMGEGAPIHYVFALIMGGGYRFCTGCGWGAPIHYVFAKPLRISYTVFSRLSSPGSLGPPFLAFLGRLMSWTATDEKQQYVKTDTQRCFYFPESPVVLL